MCVYIYVCEDVLPVFPTTRELPSLHLRDLVTLRDLAVSSS